MTLAAINPMLQNVVVPVDVTRPTCEIDEIEPKSDRSEKTLIGVCLRLNSSMLDYGRDLLRKVYQTTTVPRGVHR